MKNQSPMDSKSPRYQENNKHSLTLLPSPRHSHSSNSSTSSSGNSNGLQQFALPPTPTTPTAPPPSHIPKPITRSESGNPYPTTFVQADTTSFKQVVQMLTGSSETVKQASSKAPESSSSKTHIPPIKSMPKKQQSGSGFKLYERRNSLKNLNINPLLPVFPRNTSGFSPRKPEVLSPSILDFPSLVLSPVTPLLPDPFDRPSGSGFTRCGAADNNGSPTPILDAEAEEKAIKEKGFFLHPSSVSTPRDSEPCLLPLFPTTSPRASGSSSAS